MACAEWPTSKYFCLLLRWRVRWRRRGRARLQRVELLLGLAPNRQRVISTLAGGLLCAMASETQQTLLADAGAARGELLLALVRRRANEFIATAALDPERERAQQQTAAGEAAAAAEEHFWFSSTELLFLASLPSSARCDDMVFLVPRRDAVVAKDEAFFVRRVGPSAQPLPPALMATGEAAALDWRATLLLNLLCHAHYELRACARALSGGEGHPESEERAASAEVHAGPTLVAPGVDPTPVFPPRVCFSVGGAEGDFDKVVLRGENDALELCIEATAGALLEAASDADCKASTPSRRRVLHARVRYAEVVVCLGGQRNGRVRVATLATSNAEQPYEVTVELDIRTVFPGGPAEPALLRCTPLAVLTPWRRALGALAA